MAEKKGGCLRFGALGCLGLVLLGVVYVGVSALVAWTRLKDARVESPVVERELPGAVPGEAGEAGEEPSRPAGRPGLVVLDLANAGFEIEPGRPGEGVRIEATYDASAFELEEALEDGDDRWIYRVRFRRKVAGIVEMFRGLMGGEEPDVLIALPPDVPIELDLRVEEGGAEVELGGLWLVSADIHYDKGGFELAVSEPLVEPMERLSIRGSMGGVEAHDLGNASPARLEVDCTMGGADLDLTGDWVQDAEIDIRVRMGGVEVRVPDDVEVEGVPVAGRRRALSAEQPEIGRRTLRFSVASRMGEVTVE